jgi:hypothetical protein
MTDTTKYTAEYWDGVRAEREAQEREERDAQRDIARDLERKAIEAEATKRILRYLARAEKQASFYKEPTESARINSAYCRGKAEGLEEALAILRGVLTDRSAR